MKIRCGFVSNSSSSSFVISRKPGETDIKICKSIPGMKFNINIDLSEMATVILKNNEDFILFEKNSNWGFSYYIMSRIKNEIDKGNTIFIGEYEKEMGSKDGIVIYQFLIDEIISNEKGVISFGRMD